MPIKIIRKPSHLYRMECPQCYALLEYNFSDVESGTVKCPCCSTFNDHRGYGKPVREEEWHKNGT